MTEPLDLSGRVVIVTGGSRGVGRGIASRFLEAGARVVICGRKQPESVPEHAGRGALFVEADVREVDQIDRVVSFTNERCGRLDVLVNNAGGSPAAEALHFSQRANAVMQDQADGGCIVNVASVSGTRPSPGTAAYGAAKAGLLSLTQTLAVEWAPKVRVNAVTAGMIRTELAHLHYGDEAAQARVAASVPLGRLGEPRDVADACLFLASPLARYVTGASLLLHGASSTRWTTPPTSVSQRTCPAVSAGSTHQACECVRSCASRVRPRSGPIDRCRRARSIRAR
jgi:NAD(P)-dependent dehydrogenase (short-subunit alcohol dehydrogenase family)